MTFGAPPAIAQHSILTGILHLKVLPPLSSAVAGMGLSIPASGMAAANASPCSTLIALADPFRGAISTTIGMVHALTSFATQELEKSSEWWRSPKRRKTALATCEISARALQEPLANSGRLAAAEDIRMLGAGHMALVHRSRVARRVSLL